jgi:hypothetical protein
MKIYKTQYESLYCASLPSSPPILIEFDFLDGWEIKIFQNSVRIITIDINLKNVYVLILSNYFLHKIEKTFLPQLPKLFRQEIEGGENI